MLARSRRRSPESGALAPFAVPSRGMNARDAVSLMEPVYGILLSNVLCDGGGLKTRKGYMDWASPTGDDSPTLMALDVGPVQSIPVYYPASGAVKIFATRTTNLYDVTAGGTITTPALTGLLSPFVTSIMFHNTAGAFLLATTDNGGYHIYNGTAWSTPVAGAGVGEIGGVDPTLLCYVMEWKKRVWFVEKDSTRAWYLATSAITGAATAFDFGEHFSKGGSLVALANWTVDGGQGVDDYLIAVSSQGDVVIYQGTDPATAATFSQKGRWAIGPLPAGRRSVYASGGDVYILSQQGAIPVSKLLAAGKDVDIRAKVSLSYLIDPIIANEMKASSGQTGWQILQLAKEELILIGLPSQTGRFLALKTTTDAWSVIDRTPYTCFGAHDAVIYAGTRDGRVVKAFEGAFDGFVPGVRIGEPIPCDVTPAYQALGSRGLSKTVLLMRPTFLGAFEPVLRFKILYDYDETQHVIVPSLPSQLADAWDIGIWDTSKWSYTPRPFKRWYGALGEGVAATPQLAYSCPGDTVLTSIDLWCARGGAL